MCIVDGLLASAEEAADLIAECDGTDALIRAILQATLHPSIAPCVETDISDRNVEAQVIRELTGDIPFRGTPLVTAATEKCRETELEKFGPAQASEDKIVLANLLWRLSGASPATSIFEEQCRERVVTNNLDEVLFKRMLSASSGALTEESISEFIRSEATDAELFELNYLIEGGLLPFCGTNVAYLDYFYDLNLPSESLRCLATRSADRTLTGFVARAQPVPELVAAVERLEALCGPTAE